MDAVCDTLLLEEILPRLAPKNLLRVGAATTASSAAPTSAAGTGGALASSWTLSETQTTTGFFRASSPAPLQSHASELKLGDTNLALFPSSSARTTEEASLSSWRTAVVAHSAGGLLLCAKRLPTSQSAHYYVCNPVTRQRVVLPELRSLCFAPQCALLTVAGTRSQFQVVVIEQWQMEDADLRRKVFSSGTVHWESRRISLFESSLPFEHDFRARAVLGQSGAAYWLQPRDDTAIAYHSDGDSFQVIGLPRHLASRKRDRVIGERHAGGGLRFTEAHASVLEVWEWVCDSVIADDDENSTGRVDAAAPGWHHGAAGTEPRSRRTRFSRHARASRLPPNRC